MAARLPHNQDAGGDPIYLSEHDVGRRRMRWLALFAGMLMIAVAVAPPFDDVADRLLWAHMLQHLLLIYLAAPLLAVAILLFHARRWERRRLGRTVGRGLAVLTKPVVAFGISTIALWFWHLPAAYDYALDHEIVHSLEHLTFIVAFTLYWWVLIGGSLSPSHSADNGGRSLYLLAGAMQAGFLGGLLTLSDHVIYSHYLVEANTGGLSPLTDQQLSGAIMWFPGPLIYGLAAVFVMRDDASQESSSHI